MHNNFLLIFIHKTICQQCKNLKHYFPGTSSDAEQFNKHNSLYKIVFCHCARVCLHKYVCAFYYIPHKVHPFLKQTRLTVVEESSSCSPPGKRVSFVRSETSRTNVVRGSWDPFYVSGNTLHRPKRLSSRAQRQLTTQPLFRDDFPPTKYKYVYVLWWLHFAQSCWMSWRWG